MSIPTLQAPAVSFPHIETSLSLEPIGLEAPGGQDHSSTILPIISPVPVPQSHQVLYNLFFFLEGGKEQKPQKKGGWFLNKYCLTTPGNCSCQVCIVGLFTSPVLLCYAMLCYAKSLQSCPTLCDPMDSSPPGSPVPGILQARTLEWVAISFSSA